MQLKRTEFKKKNVLAFATVLAIVGAFLLFKIYAAGPVASFEAENSSITGAATIGSDANASGGKFLQFGSSTASTKLNWYPGYYALSHGANDKQKILDDPLTAPFTGVQFRYWWSESELSPQNYTAGFNALDADLKAVSAKSKKLMVMLSYKKFDGNPAVPADLLAGPGAWCSGQYCGELVVDQTHTALVWNGAVSSRLQAWISAMAAHIVASPYANVVSGIVFNETSLGTTSSTLLSGANYDPYTYMDGIKANLLAGTSKAPNLPIFYYHEGGFVSMDGKTVNAGQVMGDWMLTHPHIGTGSPDSTPKNPKGTQHPCANAIYQGKIPCNPNVQSPDYALTVTDSFDQSFNYMVNPAPNGLKGSFLTFSYAVGSGPNGFTFEDVSKNISSHPIPNTAIPAGW